MKNEVKTIDIQAKEWFDKLNGNSYFSGLVTVNYGMADAKEFIMPFQYGYGSSYESTGLSIIRKAYKLDSVYTSDLRDNGIIVRSNIERKCKQRELKEYK
jgi:hypothetical protein